MPNRSYRDSDAFHRSQRLREDGSPLFPLVGVAPAGGVCAAEVRKQMAMLQRRVVASGEAMG